MKRLLIFLLLILFFLPVVNATTLTDGLVLYWSLDQTSGTTAIDSLNSFNGTATNANVFSHGSPGIINTSANFTGAYDIYATPTISGTGDISMSYWFNATAMTGFDYHAVQTSAGGNNRNVFTSGTELTWASRTSTGTQTYTSTPFTLADNGNRWYHIVVIENSTGLFMYINGVLNNSYVASYTKRSFNADIRVGSLSGGSQSFEGFIDEFAVYNRSLTSSEILALYNSGDGLQYPFTTPEPMPETINITSVDITANTTGVVVDEVFNWSVTYTPANATNVSLIVDFDDTITSTANNGTYSYSIAGLYNLSVVATDGQNNSMMDFVIINVSAVPEPEPEPVNMSNVSFTAISDTNLSISGFSVSVNNGVYFGTATGNTLVLSIPENDTINRLFNLSYSKFGYYTSTYENINLSALAHEGVLVAKTYAGDESLDDKAVIWIIFALVAGIGVSAIFSRPMLIVFGFAVMFLTYFLGGNIMVSYYWFNPLGYILGAVIILTGMMRLGFGD
jgi:hypothetical protein